MLLVEDSPEFQFLVKKSLGERYNVTCVSLASEALINVKQKEFDLILLDVGLPDGDGFQLCGKIRSESKRVDVPILFLTGRSSIPDKIQGFELGADDYIVKPFDPLELRARVDARFRQPRASVKELEETVQKGSIKLDVPYQRAFLIAGRVPEKDLRLTPIEFKLLFFFMRNEGLIVTRQQLLAVVWGEGVHVIDRIIDRHVCSLRQKMEDHATYIATVPREGYRFQLPMEMKSLGL